MNLQGRTTADILVLMIASTVCGSVIASGVVISIISLKAPGTDVTVWISRITGIMNTLVGLLAGYLAGRHTAVDTAAGTPRPTDDE